MAVHVVLVGKRYYGVVDQAPGLFHVATVFFHINYVPIAPVQSFVLGPDGRVCRAVGLWPKSVLAGYLRGWLVAACGLLALVGGITAGISLVLALASGSLGPSATPQAGDVAVVGGVALGAALGFPLAWAHIFVLSERPQPGGRHPMTARLPWYLLLSAFEVLLGVGQLLATWSVRGVAAGRAAEILSVLPFIAFGCLAAALVLGFGHRLTLLLTRASYERALDLASRFGLSRDVVEEYYRTSTGRPQPERK